MRKLLSSLLLVLAVLFGLAPWALAVPDLSQAAAPSPWAALLLSPVVMSPLVSLGVSALKRMPIPFEGKTAAGIVAALTLVALLLQIAIAVLTGQVDALDMGALLPQVVDAFGTLLAAAGVYSLGKKVAQG